MTLSPKSHYFGIDAIIPYNNKTGVPYGMAKVVGSANFNLSGELVKLQGGASRYTWAVEDGFIESSLAMTFKEAPNFGYELFLGKKPTILSSTNGLVNNIVNKEGSTLFSANAVEDVTITDQANLKFGRYIVELVDKTARTVRVYCGGDIDFARGSTALEILTDALEITQANLTLADDDVIAIPGLGVSLDTAATVDLTNANDGDTFTFEIFPPADFAREIKIGGLTDVFPEFGCLIYGQQRGSGAMVLIDVYSCKALGMPHQFNEKAWSEAEVTAEAFYNADMKGVASIIEIQPS